MSRKRSRKHEASTLASGAQATLASGAQATCRMAAQARPLARSTGAAAARGVRTTRAWAAPQVERAGQVLQDSVAPRISALLSAAARRLEPARQPRRLWRKLAGGSALAAAAGAVAAVVRGRSRPDPETAAAEADVHDATPLAPMRDGQAKTSTDGEAKQPARTS
jgi:hypothetical protein